MASSFGQYTSGINPVQGIAQTGTVIADMQLKAWETVGKQFSTAIEEYAKQESYRKMQEAINNSASEKDIHSKLISSIDNIDPTIAIPDSIEKDWAKYQVSINEYNEQAKKNGGRVEQLLDKDAYRGTWLKSAKAIISNKKDLNEDLKYSMLKQMDIETDKNIELPEDDVMAGEKLMEEDYFSKVAPSETAINLARYAGKTVDDGVTPTQEVLADFNKSIKLGDITREEKELEKRKLDLEKAIKSPDRKNAGVIDVTALGIAKAGRGLQYALTNQQAIESLISFKVGTGQIKESDVTPEYMKAMVEAAYDNPLLAGGANVLMPFDRTAKFIAGDLLTDKKKKELAGIIDETQSKLDSKTKGRSIKSLEGDLEDVNARIKKLGFDKQTALNPDVNPATGKVEISPEKKLKQELTQEVITTEEEAQKYGATFEMGDFIQKQKLERAEKKEATRAYYEQTYGRVPWNFDSLFDERMPAPETMVDPKTGVAFVKKKNGDWDALPVGKQTTVEEQQKEKAFSFGAIGADSNRLRDKNGNYVPVELSKGSGIFASGKIEGNVEHAIKVKKSATDGAEVIRMLRNDIIPLFDKSGVTINPQESAKYMAKLGKLKALMRPELIGAGSVSDWEQKELGKGTPNPTSWTAWVTSMGGEKGKAEELLKMLEQNLDNLATQNGFVIKDRGKTVDPATTALAKFNNKK